MCVANSARSQLAEGLARKLFGGNVEVKSAGSKPSHVNPYAIKVMNEIGIDISENSSKTVGDLPADFLEDLNFVITLCAEEVCPIFHSKAKKLHWPMPDPATTEMLSDDEQLKRFRATRDNLTERLKIFAQEMHFLGGS